jgi:crotonobetainyl-CoA:carnitine CoA-transferase CaiB-like acyl-CoA transferase
LPLPILSISRGRVASLELDLKQTPDRQVVLDLIGDADVFVENWRPGVARSLGLDRAALLALNPRLTYVSASGFGASGPMAGLGSMDSIASAVGGLSSVSGPEDGPGERTRFALVDFMSAMVTAESALAALLAQELTGEAQLAESSQLEATVAAVGPLVTWASEHQQDARPLGSADRWACPSFSLVCADGEAVALHVETDAEWRALARGLGLPADPAWASRSGRLADRARVEAAVTGCLAGRPSAEAAATVQAIGVPATRVRRSVAAALEGDARLIDAHVVTRHGPQAGWVMLVRPPWELADTPLDAGWPCPGLGQTAEPEWRAASFPSSTRTCTSSATPPRSSASSPSPVPLRAGCGPRRTRSAPSSSAWA